MMVKFLLSALLVSAAHAGDKVVVQGFGFSL